MTSTHHVNVRYTFVNRKTRSTLSGKTWVEGESFHDVSDGLQFVLEDRKAHLIHKQAPGEDPAEWKLGGFSDHAEYKKRVKRAREACDGSVL